MSADEPPKPAIIENDTEPTPTTTFNWPPLESNPEVFSSYLHTLGLSPAFSIGEVFGFDEDLLAFLPQPILGIIVCYERLKSKDELKSLRPQDFGTKENYDKVKYYMHQSKVLDNACGLIACLHAILNSSMASDAIEPSSILGKFKERTASSTPSERCTALEQDVEFRTAHKSYASKGQSREITEDQSKVKHHFVAYVVNEAGELVELDGTKEGPVVLGKVEELGGDVLRGGIKEIQGRLERGEISESLSMMTLNLTQE